MQFSRELSVGNRILDSEHKNLRGIIDGITSLIMASDVAALSGAFELLGTNLRVYFAVEENIARAVGFDFTQHRLAHQYLLDEFRRIKNGLMAQNGSWSKLEKAGYINSLRRCLIRHITEDGKPLKIVLSDYLYDFKPASLGGCPDLHGIG
jgi:hemerythrin-like metal-binding protein